MIVPNATGARLVTCSVSIERTPETITHSLTERYIVAFEISDKGHFVPLTLAGKIIGWGELRASVVGCFVYGIGLISGGPIQGAEQDFSSLELFVEYARRETLAAVRGVRKEKGWYK